MTISLTYRTSDFDAALDLAEAEDDRLDAETIEALYAEHIATAAAADVLIFDRGEDVAALLVRRRGSRVVREYL